MFNFPKCPKCGATLPIATGVCASCPISPLSGQEDQSARLAASAEVGQVEGTTCSRCGYCHGSVTCVSDDEAVAWFDSQTEEFLAALPGYGEDGFTPRKAWNAFFAGNQTSSPMAVQVGQVEGTIHRPIGEYLVWLYAELARLDGMPSSPEYLSYRDCQAALRVYMRFVNHRLGRA